MMDIENISHRFVSNFHDAGMGHKQMRTILKLLLGATPSDVSDLSAVADLYNDATNATVAVVPSDKPVSRIGEKAPDSKSSGGVDLRGLFDNDMKASNDPVDQYFVRLGDELTKGVTYTVDLIGTILKKLAFIKPFGHFIDTIGALFKKGVLFCVGITLKLYKTMIRCLTKISESLK